ncbi:MAG: GldG family protein [Thermoanaerobaculia bacterium]|nr:GldG family protein [Thermoanaerobaculia bacterium]
MSPNETKSQRPGAIAQGSLLTAGVVVVLALFALVNYLGLRHYERFDWTGSDIYTLSEKSEKIVQGLDRDVQLIVLLDPSAPSYAQVDELVDRYVAANPARIVRRDLDRAKSALEFQQLVADLGIESANTLVIESEGDKRVVNQYELVEYDYSAAQMGGSPKIKEFKGEQEITSAILSLVEAEKPKVVFTIGHGETTLEGSTSQRSLSEARRLLGRDNFEIDTWQSLDEPAVPEGTDLVVISAPTTRFTPPELESLSRWVGDGGRLLVFLEPSFEAGTTALKDVGLSEWLAAYGIETARNVVIDPGASVAFFGPDTIYTDAFGSHPVVESLAQTRAPVMLAGATSVNAGEGPEGAQIEALVSTTDQAWGETNVSEEGVAQDAEDLSGPLGLAVAVALGGNSEHTAANSETDGSESDESAGESRIVVFGDLDFATDSLLAQGANSLLFVNTFNWLVEREELIEIEGRMPEQTQLTMASGEIYSLGAVVLLLMPGSALFLGIWIALRRRR